MASLSPSSGGRGTSCSSSLRHPALGHRPAHGEQQVGAIRRFGEIGRGAGVKAVLGGELIAVAGENHHRDIEPPAAQVFEQPETVHARHLDVEQRGVGLARVEQIEGLECVRGLFDLVSSAAEDPIEHATHAGIVVDDENSTFHADMVAAGSSNQYPSAEVVRDFT